MSKIILFFFVIALTLSIFALKKDPDYLYARRNGAETKIHLHVVDDGGMDVSNVTVRVFMGMNFRPKGYWINGVTDEKGYFIIQGKTCGDELEIFISKNGYYDSYKKLCFAKMGAEHKVEDGKWLPFNKSEKITLRKIEKPTTLITLNKLIDVAYTNSWLGFDMKKKDFVKPFGCGNNIDFEVKVEWDGLPAWKSKSCSAKIRFKGEGSGGYYAKNVLESFFPYTYRAEPNCSYVERMVCVVDRNGNPYTTKIPFVKDSSFVIRTRCQMDKGKIKVANYGCIRHFEIGPSRRGIALLYLSYIFNPTPNDTNLEDIETATRSQHFIRQCEPPSPSPKKKRKSLLSF